MSHSQNDAVGPTKKGCSRCTKRRIKCDLGRPSCLKCTRKGFECPGYGSQLRWVGGVATRGRLKHLQASVLEASLKGTGLLEEDTGISKIESICGYPLQDLMDYYDKNVCKVMVWVDSGDNIFRQHILPLAKTNPAVRFAIAATSAQNISATRGERDVSEDARNEAVLLITRRITDITSRVMNGHDPDNELDAGAAEWILACMLVLSAYEMARSGAADTEFHRKAARALINTLSTTECRRSALYISLRNKVSTFDIFASTTSFDASATHDTVLPDPDTETLILNETTLFSSYLKLLHEVTLLSRQGGQAIATSNRDWRAEFEMARGATLMASGKLDIDTPQRRRDFVRLVEIHYHAALLYVARCLNYRVSYDTATAFSDLKRNTLAMEDLDGWIHNLPWPFFIAGAECQGDPENQALVAKLYADISRVTGLKHYHEVLEFLHAFWASSEQDWRTLARHWEAEGKRILAY